MNGLGQYDAAIQALEQRLNEYGDNESGEVEKELQQGPPQRAQGRRGLSRGLGRREVSRDRQAGPDTPGALLPRKRPDTSEPGALRFPQRGRLTSPGAASQASSEAFIRARVTTASAAWAPWSRLPPPVRASAWSMFSTVSTPKAHGTPVRNWTSMIPRAASEQT